MSIQRFIKRYGPWAAVTGASDGIGRACSVELARRGFNLVLAARSEERLEALSTLLESDYGIASNVIACDLSDQRGRDRFLRETEAFDIGLLVAAAGFGTSGPFTGCDLGIERAMLDVNCWAPLEQSVEFGRRFAKRGSGGIVLFSSLVGWQGVPGAAHYAATKAYIQSLVEGLRRELMLLGVDVIASAPGPVASGFARRAKMTMARAETPQTVARITLDSLGRHTTAIPGALSKLLTYSLAPLPRWARVRILERVMSGMTTA